MELEQLVNQVNSKETFLEFVRALVADWDEEQKLEKKSPSNPFGRGAKGWENGSIGSFLDAMQAWTVDSREKILAAPDWKTFARILLAGKFYE
jgi:hypothetical protein